MYETGILNGSMPELLYRLWTFNSLVESMALGLPYDRMPRAEQQLLDRVLANEGKTMPDPPRLRELDLADLLAANLYDTSVSGQGRDTAPPWLAVDHALRDHWTRIAVEAVTFLRRMDAFLDDDNKRP